MEHQTTKITNTIQKQKSKVGLEEPGFETQYKISTKVEQMQRELMRNEDLEIDPHVNGWLISKYGNVLSEKKNLSTKWC